MLGWLRKKAEEAAAQVNPFDGGKTASTVRAQRPASSPVPTRSAPRQQAPSYGSGIGGFINRTRDVFDANTAQDLWKRDMAAQQAWQAPVQMPKLGQSYYDEQKALDQLALQDAERRSSIEQAAYNALGGFGNRVAKTPGAIADHYADAMRNKKASNLVSDPITSTTTQLAYAGDFLKGKLFGEDAPKASERAGTQVQDAAERADNTIDSTVQQSRFGQRGTDNKIVAGASRGIGDVGAQILTARATGSNVAPSALAGLQTSTAQTRAAQDAGFSYEDARSVGVTQGAVQAATEKIGLDKLKFPVGNNFLARGASRFITEGTQEGGQELLSNLITNKSYDPNKGLTEGVKEAALFGGIAGGAMGGAFDIPTLFNQNTSKPLSPNTQQKRDTLANAYTTAVDQGRPEVAQQIANQINAIDTPPTTRLVGRVQNGLSALAGDQRGSVPFELGGKQMTSALDAQAYTNFDSFYNDYKPFFADSNLDVNDARAVYEKAINEPATPTGTRGSRISSSAQTQFEQAYNVGDMETAKQFAQQIQDPTARNVALQAVGGNTTTETQVTNPTVQAMIEAAQARKQQAKPTTRLVQRVTAPFRDEAGAIGRNIRGEGKPEGFILKETKGRAGKKDTIRVKQGAKGLEATQQSEPTIEAQQYANTFGVPVEQAQQDMARMENQDPGAGTRKALDRVKNSGKDNVVDDMIDQKQYGVKDIKAEPTSTLDDFINKELGVDQLTDAEMTASNRDKGVSKLRDNIRNTNVLRKANDAAARGLEKLSRGGAIARRANRVAQYINKNAGQDPAMIEAAQKYAGENTYADASLMQIGKKAYDLLPDEASRARVHAVLDPESAGDSVKFDDLTPNEKQALSTLRDLGEAINDTSYRTGMISKKKWESNRGGRYIARLYNEVATTQDVADLLELPDKRGLHLGMYKSRVEMNDKMREQLIRDPVKLAVIRARQVRQNEALIDYMSTAESKGYVSTKPKDGFVKVTPQNRMANWSGKYVRQDVYENVEGFRAMGKGMNAVNNLLDVYDGLPPRRLRKKTLTIFNPVVRTGNVTSNYFFAYLNGVNPVTFQKNKGWAKSALKGNDPLKIAAQRSGLIGNDIISSDRNLFDARKSFMNELDASSGNKIGNKLKNMNERITQRYGEADDIAKLAAMKAHVDRGYSVKQAIDMTRRGFQDYSRVGHAYDMAAKAPVFGNAFVRFQGDLYTNIIKNAAVDHPMRLGAMVAGIALLGEGLSNLSGESDEDKKTREDRAGAPKIPFTNVSTEFQTPVGAIDVARFTPLYMRQDIDGNSFADQLSRLSPVNIPSNLSKTELIKKAASDPLIGPVISTVGDTDWRGKSVADPDGVRDGKELYPDNPLSSAERNRNRAQYGVRSYAPYPFNEIGDIAASFNQNKRNEQAKDGGKYDPRQENVDLLGRTGFNTSGSKKSLGQSIGRLGGIRAQEYNADDAAKAREDAKMFAFFDNTDKFKAGLDSKTREQFETRHKGTQTRDGIKAEFESDPWYKYKNAGELLQNPKLFEAEKKYAEMQNKYDGRPIDPLFNLPENQRNVVLAKKLKLPGSKDEGFNTLYDQDWYQNFRKKQDEFYTSKSAYAKKRGWSDYESDNPYPEAKKDVQKAIDYYFDLPAGGQRTSFRNNNPQLWAAITGQWDQQNVWTDKERAKLGLPAIPRDEKTSYSSSSGSRGSSRSRRSGRGSRGGSRSAKGKFDYKLDAFAPKGGNLSKQLAKLVENAGKKSKPKIKKTKNYA